MSDTDKMMKEHFAQLIAKRDAVFAKTVPLRNKRDAALAKAQPFIDEAKKLADQYMAIERDEGLFDLQNEIGRVAKFMGGRAMSQSNV